MISGSIAMIVGAAYWAWSNVKALLIGSVAVLVGFGVGYLAGGNNAYHHFKVKNLQSALSAYKQNPH